MAICVNKLLMAMFGILADLYDPAPGSALLQS